MIIVKKESLSTPDLSKFKYMFYLSTENSTFSDDILRIANKHNIVRLYAKKGRTSRAITFYACINSIDYNNFIDDLTNNHKRIPFKINSKSLLPFDMDEYYSIYVIDYYAGDIMVK